MIEINEFKLPMKPAEACSFFKRITDNFGVFFDLDRINEYIAMLSLRNRELDTKVLDLTHDPNLSLYSKSY